MRLTLAAALVVTVLVTSATAEAEFPPSLIGQAHSGHAG